jgi:hypothetical protein
VPLARGYVWLRLVHVVSFGGLAAFVVAVSALHGLHGALDPVDHTVSDYSLGSYGWLMRAAFGALGLGILATAESLRLTVEPSSGRRLGLLLLACTSIGVFLDAGYNTDRPRVPETFDGTVHGVGMLIICLSMPAATLVLGSGLMATSRAALRARCLLVLGAAQLVANLGFEMSPMDSRGLTERVAIAVSLATLFLLRSFAFSPGDRGATPGRSLTFGGMRSRRLVSVPPYRQPTGAGTTDEVGPTRWGSPATTQDRPRTRPPAAIPVRSPSQ